jgi:uncharacterized protein YbcI
MDAEKHSRGPWLAGEQLMAISNAMVGLHRRYYGRGATRARTHQVHADLLLVELRDVYLTVERTLLERGQQDAVRHTRLNFQQATYQEFVEAVQLIVGRAVMSYATEAFVNPEAVIELFYLAPSLEPDEEAARRQE